MRAADTTASEVAAAEEEDDEGKEEEQSSGRCEASQRSASKRWASTGAEDEATDEE